MRPRKMKITLVQGRFQKRDYHQHENKLLRLYNNYTVVPAHLGFCFLWFQLPAVNQSKNIKRKNSEINNS